MWHIHTVEYHSALKGNPIICNNTDEPEGHYVKWNKSVIERQILHDNTHMKYLRQSNSWKQRTELQLAGAGGGGKREFLISKYKISVMQNESRDQLYNIVSIGSNTVLYT